jgi:hypothetical protein
MAAQKDANGMLSIDADQVIRSTADITDDGQIVQKVLPVGGTLVPKVYDSIALTYVNAGNGVGEIETVTYKFGVATVATLTLSYDGSNRLINVVKS